MIKKSFKFRIHCRQTFLSSLSIVTSYKLIIKSVFDNLSTKFERCGALENVEVKVASKIIHV